MRSGVFEHEQHAAVGGELRAPHQAAFALLRGGGDFDLESVWADGQRQSRVGFCRVDSAHSRSSANAPARPSPV